ncbi:hypothetical protein SAMN00120144_1698 [Hymenobacter roseosalivarius DSM 11622]|uniref:Glycosyltransferase RgtA/B/C/D-like domain-containing protein n=1 Tax=Hymenobacter roseosalivarius DSM 11622 TaxID=645990 RepID=A0A1W1W3Q5_9BACT|nr:hypothetical protein [Hymenobacter roseosalivarius]SMC00268.1 hypothetical protein SAMN00120144_1698 [Hymenobacter roseosalivarius DSM 11622]
MRVLVAIGLNSALLVALVCWLRRQPHASALRWALLPGLGFRLLAGTIAYVWLTSDSAFFQYWGEQLTTQLWANPTAWLRTLLGEEFHKERHHLVYHGFSNTFFLIKLLSVLNLGSLGNAWLNGIYLSVFSFVGSWQLIRAVEEAFPRVPVGAAVVAWLAWPSVVYWSSGITKESLLVGSGAWLTALILGWLYGGRPVRALAVVGALLLAVLHFKMRFFFAGLLLGGLISLLVVRLVQRFFAGAAQHRLIQLLIIQLVLVGGTRLAAEVLPVLRINKFTNQLSNNYYQLLRASQSRPHIEYADLKPTLESMLSYVPKAIVSTITRPWLGEDKQLLYIVAGLENLALVALTGVAFIALVRQRPGYLPFALVVVLVLYCLALAALLGLSTPNLGTLNRYRAVLLPYLVFLLLQNEYVARWLPRLSNK